MDFHPNGINNLTGNYIFATATNCADGGVEVLGAYASGISNFTIYDWSFAEATFGASLIAIAWVLPALNVLRKRTAP